MSSLDPGGFGESAASLTFHDPDDEVLDTQADDFRFNFTLPSQHDFSASMPDELDNAEDDQLQGESITDP